MAALHNRSITLECENLYYNTGNKSDKKTILRGINGRFRPGKLCAILGPSGAGKTSLLNVLSGYKSQGVEGLININGQKLDRNWRALLRKQSCYITQDFEMMALLTVSETLDIAARFKLKSASKEKRMAVIEDIANILGLGDSMNTEVRFLSGGEQKRLSIGVELVTHPPVMFFDEPTSGLDSRATFLVMTHLKKLSEGQGITVIVVIHQPSSRIFQLCDDVFLMSNGQCLYNGPTAELGLSLFKFGFHCQPYYNIAEFAIEVACGERGSELGHLIDEAARCHRERLGDFYQDKQVNMSGEDSEVTPTEQTPILTMDGDGDQDVKVSFTKPQSLNHCMSVKSLTSGTFKRYPVSMYTQFTILFMRCTYCINRDLQLSVLRILTHIVVAFLLGILYYDFGNDADKVYSNFSFIFFNVLFLFFGTAMPTVLTFPLEAKVFFREHSNNWYSLRAYYFAKILADLPLQIFCPTLFLLIGYFLTGQPLECSRFFMLWFVCVLVSILAQTFGNIAGAAFDVQTAVFIVPSSAIPMFLLSGYFLTPKDLYAIFQIVSQLSYFKFAFEAAIQSIFGYNRPRLSCSQPYCHYRFLYKFIQDIGMSDFTYWQNVGFLSLWIFVMQLVLYAVLKYKLAKAKT